MKRIILITALLASTVAFAESANVLDTNEAVTATLTEFEASQSQAVVDSFSGIKAWPVPEGVKAKVYLEDSKSVSYSCHRHDASAPMECHEI